MTSLVLCVQTICHCNCELPKIKEIFTFIVIREQLIVIISKYQNNLHHHQSAVVERTESRASASTANAPNAPAVTNEVSFCNHEDLYIYLYYFIYFIVSMILKIIIYLSDVCHSTTLEDSYSSNHCHLSYHHHYSNSLPFSFLNCA